MKSAHRILIPVLAMAIGLWTGCAKAGTHEQAGTVGTHPHAQHQDEAQKTKATGHSHERSELHGGHVTMTKAHHFETVFAPDGIRLYMYSAEQNPLPMDKVTGTITLTEMSGTEMSGTSREVKLVANVPKEGEQVVYFCTMYDSAPQMTPGKCANCGMNLVPQDGLFAAADLSKAEPGTIKAAVHLIDLGGDEKEVTFIETNTAEEHEGETPASPTSGKSKEDSGARAHPH